jgi:4a-hydroxytetrahydrobiopterin dehydratase
MRILSGIGSVYLLFCWPVCRLAGWLVDSTGACCFIAPARPWESSGSYPAFSEGIIIFTHKTCIQMKTLDQQRIDSGLQGLDGWLQDGDRIRKDFEFRDFSEATGFLMRVALISEKMDHHAEYSGVYNKLSLVLSTHDAGGITDLDLKFAGAVESLT